MGRVVHFEIHADDPLRAQAFYENVFGWKVEKWSPPPGASADQAAAEYWLVMTGKQGSKLQGKENDGIDGAILRRQGQTPAHNNPVSAFVCTIEVDAIDDTCSLVVQNGGNVVVDKVPVPGIGWSCYCKDTEGNIFGLMQPDDQAGKR